MVALGDGPRRISWFVVPDGGERMPHRSQMRGRWGWDAVCDCGWDSRTGGATRRAVERATFKHLVVVHGEYRWRWA